MTTDRTPRLNDDVLYWPSPKAPQGPAGTMQVNDSAKPMKATISAIHGARLVNLRVADHGDESHRVNFVPLLHGLDPDPQSPVGRCRYPDDVAGVASVGGVEAQVIGAADVGRVEDAFRVPEPKAPADSRKKKH